MMPEVLQRFTHTDCEPRPRDLWADTKRDDYLWVRDHFRPRKLALSGSPVFLTAVGNRYYVQYVSSSAGAFPPGIRCRIVHETARDLPRVLRHIDDAIDASRRILELEPDDELGEIGYAEETWLRAVEFLRKYSERLWNSAEHVLDAPKILPGPDGSIDIHWDEPNYEILINIPADPTVEAGFYGDDRGAISMKGTFDANTLNHGLHLWLMGAK